jgi:uncharacterized YigZ family protein
MSEQLYTLESACTHEVTIKKSRFLAQAAPVSTLEAALDFVRETEHPDANHDCWAYRIGTEYRFNDDGEPSGSAGKPILAAIDGQDMEGVAVVVTRWFGGVKLGIGGLMRAYGGTAAECLRRAASVPIIPSTALVLECAYSHWPVIRPDLEAMQADIRHEAFGAHGVTVELSLPDEHVEGFEQLAANVTRGQGRVHEADQL